MLSQLILATYILHTVTLNDIYDSLHPKIEMPSEMSKTAQDIPVLTSHYETQTPASSLRECVC